ncbi:MAG: DnaJ family molecular chaperone [Rhizobiaceae bacterium]|nr:MAG: DnaJ family molecular chaperone [Rhizobiaceae bacterium]
MSIWTPLAQFVDRVSGKRLSNAVEVVRTLFAGDPELRRRVSFSIAMIALSAKMAKADGVVTQDEVRAFQQIFAVPESETHNVARLYDLAKQDTAGYELYAERIAGLCGSGEKNCLMLEDILDGLFHIAKADGVVHEREVKFLRRVAEIFEIGPQHFDSILARHVDLGDADPYRVLGIARDVPFEELRRHYRRLVAENHPDKLIARGVPPEFVAIANARVAAINAAYEMIERRRRAR